MARITQNEIASQLGVSRSTVAAALNPASTVKLSEATRQRIIQAAERLHYRPDRHARIMRGGPSGLIGILHFGGLLQVAAERAAHAANAVRRRNLEVVATDLSWSVESIQAACTSLLDACVEGVIVAGMNDPAASDALERLRSAALPVVTLSGNPLPWGPHFRGDTRRAIADLTRHLIALGHRKIALMTHFSDAGGRGIYLWSGEERKRGFEDALREAGGEMVETLAAHRPRSAPPQGILIRTRLSDDPFDPFVPGIEGMHTLLERPDRPTAVLCSNDELAYGALRVCRERGISVPRELALTGYDDTALGRYCQVPLTTVRQPSEAMAEASVNALLALLGRNEADSTPSTTLFPCEVIYRESSGQPLTA